MFSNIGLQYFIRWKFVIKIIIIEIPAFKIILSRWIAHWHPINRPQREKIPTFFLMWYLFSCSISWPFQKCFLFCQWWQCSFIRRNLFLFVIYYGLSHNISYFFILNESRRCKKLQRNSIRTISLNFLILILMTFDIYHTLPNNLKNVIDFSLIS